jgi:carbon monoxide dehydrogenase subunit G
VGSWSASVHVAKPPEAVWNVIGDYSKTPEWLPKVKAATQSPGPFGPGTKVSVTRGPMTINFTVEEAAPPSQVKMSIVQGKVTGTTVFVLKPEGPGTLVEHSLDLHFKGLMRLFSPFMKGGIRKDLAALKKRAEGLQN